MNYIKKDIISNIHHIKDSQIWISEANFALSHILDDLNSLPDNSHVLEVGSGSGILLKYILNNFKNLEIVGIEPYAKDFSNLKKFHQCLKGIENNLFITSYEKFEYKKKFDYIFLINVFEHLNNWRDFLSFIENNLTSNGKCLILCPNYGFPYESHFNIPIIINKKITYQIFKNKIIAQEKNRNAEGLWKSLNFVTYSKLVKECKKNGKLRLNPDNKIFEKMIARVSYDSEFKGRRKLLSNLAFILNKLGLLKFFQLKFMRFIDPYMKIHFSRIR